VARIRLNPREVQATVNDLARKDALRVARLVESRAKVLAPVDTGRLRASIKITRKLTIRGVGYAVGTDVEYATYVENGTRPHKIRPKAKQALRFKVGGKYVFAAVVNHPGTRANPFLARAVREVGIANNYRVTITG